jgi:hypothetical protein
MQRASIVACFVSLLALSLRPVKDSSWLIMDPLSDTC